MVVSGFAIPRYGRNNMRRRDKIREDAFHVDLFYMLGNGKLQQLLFRYMRQNDSIT